MSDLARSLETGDVGATVETLLDHELLERKGRVGSRDIFGLTEAGHRLCHVLAEIHDAERPLCTPRGQG